MNASWRRPGLSGANRPTFGPLRVIAPAASSPFVLIWNATADVGMWAVQMGERLSFAIAVTVLSFSRSYTSPIGRRPLALGAPMIRCRPLTPIATGPDVVSKTVMIASSSDTNGPRKGDVGYTMPPYDVVAKYSAVVSPDGRYRKL